MKNLFVLPALAFGLLIGTQNSTAQDVAINDTETVTSTVQEYIEIAPENLPKPVLDAVAANMPDATIEKAEATQDASEFKLTVKQGEKVSEVVFDAEGNIKG
ncbi:hypothetical protein [Aquimarina algicola]|uniref:Beta-lactamase-inhibitor-like PepSY-like domain-containing protein n=1 Tax=Aquimarina algicola TaxID=2589995 RepID=A0A504JHZ4_9FLAO|nr:hypothetical protein [Aquimarina algicola]TPN87283.1 hypothetical protein FHK87_06765 [Aquimarina algicola]